MGKEKAVACFKLYIGILLRGGEEVRKLTKKLKVYTQPTRRYLTPGHPEYETEILKSSHPTLY
jgi:hypothetical protein